MSDYLGGLKLRNSILSVITLLQLPVMILSIRFYGSQGALYSYLGLMIVLSTLYFLLVQYIFFNSIKVVIRPEVLFFVFACSLSTFLSYYLCLFFVPWFNLYIVLSPGSSALASLLVFSSCF